MVPSSTADKAQELDTLIQLLTKSQDTNLIEKSKQLKTIQDRLTTVEEKIDRQRLENALKPVLDAMSVPEFQKDLRKQQRWAKFGFPESVLSTHAKCVQLMMRSGFGYTLKAFMNSGLETAKLHDIALSETREPLIRMNGKFCPWSKIESMLEYDKKSGKVVSRENPQLAYNYISPHGIVQKDPVPDELYPIDQLTESERASLMAHAKKFFSVAQPEIDPGIPKECVLQLATFEPNDVSHSWLKEGFLEVTRRHITLRLIDDKGKVFAFGLMPSRAAGRYSNSSHRHWFASGYSKVTVPDYLDENRVTSVPLTAKRMNDILEFVKEINKDNGWRFCITKQNCTKFGMMVLALAGITIDIKMTPGEMLYRLVPKLEKAPVVGGPYAWIRDGIKNVVTPIFATSYKYTPAPITQAISVASDVLFYLPRKTKAVAFNLLFIYLGGFKEAEKLESGKPTNEPINDQRAISFTSLMTRWSQILDGEKNLVLHSRKLIDWQNEQPTTILFKYQEEAKFYFPTASTIGHDD